MSLGDELLSVPFASALRGLWSHKYEFDGKHLSSIVFSHMIQHNADRNRWKGRRAIVKLIARCYSLTRNDSELDSNYLTVTLVVRHFSRPNFNYSNFDKTSLFSHKIAGNSILADALLSHFRCPWFISVSNWIEFVVCIRSAFQWGKPSQPAAFVSSIHRFWPFADPIKCKKSLDSNRWKNLYIEPSHFMQLIAMLLSIRLIRRLESCFVPLTFYEILVMSTLMTVWLFNFPSRYWHR